jgi:hypothetical protein
LAYVADIHPDTIQSMREQDRALQQQPRTWTLTLNDGAALEGILVHRNEETAYLFSKAAADDRRFVLDTVASERIARITAGVLAKVANPAREESIQARIDAARLRLLARTWNSWGDAEKALECALLGLLREPSNSALREEAQSYLFATFGGEEGDTVAKLFGKGESLRRLGRLPDSAAAFAGCEAAVEVQLRQMAADLEKAVATVPLAEFTDEDLAALESLKRKLTAAYRRWSEGSWSADDCLQFEHEYRVLREQVIRLETKQSEHARVNQDLESRRNALESWNRLHQQVKELSELAASERSSEDSAPAWPAVLGDPPIWWVTTVLWREPAETGKAPSSSRRPIPENEGNLSSERTER